MHIYIDESGAFVVPHPPRQHVCGVGALVIPSAAREQLFYEFLRISDTWPVNAIEHKGSKLDEEQVDTVVRLLPSHDTLLEFCGIDMGTTQIPN